MNADKIKNFNDMFENPGREERCVAWRAEQVPSEFCLDVATQTRTGSGVVCP
jgi:hypothetical protein